MSKPKYSYRVMGTADAFADRGKLFSHATATIARKVETEERARELAADFELEHKPAGSSAYIVVEQVSRDGELRTLLHRRGSLHGWKGDPCWTAEDGPND